MAVTFTTNIGLAKPDETEIAEKWVNLDELQEDNNIQIADKMDIGLRTYTPVIKAQIADPVIGAGSINGEYVDIEGVLMGSFTIVFLNPGIGVGNGEYAVSLPEEVDGSFHSVGTAFNSTPGAFSVIGQGHLNDDSAVNTSGGAALDCVTVAGTSYVRFITETYAAPVKTNRLATSSLPFAPGNADRYTGFFIYKKA